MLTKQTELTTLERQVRGLWASITSGAMWVSGKSEAEYLIGGHTTDMIEKTWVPNWCERYAHAFVYGVIAADKSEWRYVWIYLFYRHHIWRCHNLKEAIKLIKRIEVHNKFEQKLRRLERRLEAKCRTTQACCN